MYINDIFHIKNHYEHYVVFPANPLSYVIIDFFKKRKILAGETHN